MAKSLAELSDAELEALANEPHPGESSTLTDEQLSTIASTTKPSRIEDLSDEELQKIATPVTVDGLTLGEPPKPERSSPMGAAARSAAMNVVPTIGGLITGAGGILAGGFTGPGAIVTSPVLGVAGGAAGGHVTAQAQDKFLKSILPDETYQALQEQLSADQEEQPIANFLGGFIPQAATFHPSLTNVGNAVTAAKNIATQPVIFSKALRAGDPHAVEAFSNLLNVGLGAGVGGGPEAYKALTDPEHGSVVNAALAFGLGALLNKPTRIGKALSFEKTVQAQQERFARLAATKAGESATVTPSDETTTSPSVTAELPPQSKVADIPEGMIPTESIASRPDLMQFKRMDDSATGTNAEDSINGDWNDLYSGVLTVWQPKDKAAYGLEPSQDYIVVNGHHRLAKAQNADVKQLRVQVLREADGVTPGEARAIGAEINIADGKGTIYDQAKYLREQAKALGENEALGIARQIGARGRNAAAIALKAEDNLFHSFINEQITPEQAATIAETAPRHDGLQRVGIEQAREGRAGEDLANFIEAVKANSKPSEGSSQYDLFGSDDAAIAMAERMARAASSIQREISEKISAVQGAAKRPEQARELGVNVSDPEAVRASIEQLKASRDDWNNWALKPELVKQVRQKAGLEPMTPEVAAVESKAAARSQEPTALGELIPAEDLPFNLTGENAPAEWSVDGELARRAAVQAEADRQVMIPGTEKTARKGETVDARTGDSEPLGARGPLTRDELQAVVAPILKQFPGAPEVKIVQSIRELPETVRNLMGARASLGSVVTKFKDDMLRFMMGRLSGGARLDLGRASEALQLGGLHDGPIAMKQDVLEKARDKHGIPLQKLMRLPEKLHDPIMIFDSATEPNASVVVTDLSHDGKPLIAAVHMKETVGGIEINEIQSIHPRPGEHIANWIKDGLARYYNKEKARGWLSQWLSGVQSPAAWVQLQADKNIRTNADLSQVKSLGEPPKPGDTRASIDAGRIEAVFDPTGEKPQIYVIADNLHSPERAVKAVLEEVVGHYGVRQVTGDKFARLVSMVWRDYKADPRLHKIAREYGLDLKTIEGKAVAAEEFVAKLARNEIKAPTLLEKAVTWLRETLREVPAFKNLSFSEAELKTLLARAKTAMQTGPDGKTVQTPAPKATRAGGREAVDATVEQATLPRHIEAPPFVSQDGKPIALSDIRQYLSKALDVPMRLGVGRKRALGFYSPKRESIRLRALNDVPTIAHEVGHYLHYLLFPGAGASPIASDFARRFDAELFPLGKVTSRASYTPEQIRKEGVAEFFRQYLTDNSKALAAAPRFYSMFEGALQKNYPEVWKIVTQARETTQRYIAQPDWEKAKAQISFDADAGARKWTPTEWAQKFYTRWVNELAPLESTMHYLRRLGTSAAQAQRVIDLAVNYKGGWRGKAEHDLHLEQTNLNGKVVGPGLRKILSGVDDLREFSTYLALKRAQEKRRQGIKTGFEGLDVDAKLNELEPRYEAKRKQLASYQDNAVNLLVESGILSAEQKVQMQLRNQDYVPFYRVYESVGGNASGKTGKGFINVSNPVRRMKGSDLAIVDPLESIVKNTYVFRDLAERQRVGSEFIKTVMDTQGGGRVADAIAKPMKPVQVQHEEVMAKLREMVGDLPDDLGDLSFTIFRAARGISSKDGTFSVWKNGKEQLYQLGDPELARALSMSDSVDAEVMAKIPFMGAFKKGASILRAGATLTPEFMMRNYFRDQVTAAVFSKYGFIPFFDGARGIFSALRKDEWYRDWAKSGGHYAGISVLGREDMRTTLGEITKDPGAVRLALDLMNPANVLKNLAKASEIMETGTRIAEFRRARQSGETELAAANAAKDVTLNFSRYGMKGKVVNQMSAFFNAAIQDMDKIARAHKERPVQTALKGFMYISAPSILAWYLGKDDPKIQELPEWRKQLFWNVNMDGFVLSLPKPFLLGAIYGTSVEKALDFAYDKDPNAVKKLGQSIMQNTLIRDDLLVALNLFRPTIENITNYSFFREAPIVPRSMQTLSPELQFTPGTSHVARWLGDVLNVSPLKVDNMIRGHFGGMGKYGTDAIDFTMAKMGLVDVPVEPTRDLSEFPLIRSFVASPYAPSEYVERFFKGAEKAEQRLRDFSKLQERKDLPAIQEYWLKNRNEGMWYQSTVPSSGRTVIGEIRAQRKSLGEISKAMALIQESKTMGPDEKRERLHYLKETRDTIAKNVYLKLMHPTDRKATF